MIRTQDETIAGSGAVASFGNGRCLWDKSVCVDTPTHFVALELADGTDAEVFCVRHYVLALAHLCQVHLPICEGDFSGHVVNHGELGA
jgi:hypothetical protein